MNEGELKQKLADLAGDAAFAKKFAECKTPEATLALFAEEGVELTLEQLKALAADADELDEDALEGVAGGSSQDEKILEEMLQYSRSSVLTSSAQEMLKQANPQAELIRQLLG